MSEAASLVPKKTTSFLMMLWYVFMFLCTLILHAIGIFTKDSSVDAYVMLGIIVMLAIPVVNIASAIIRINELKKEDAERERREAELKASLHASTEEEIQEQEREKIRAAKELAARQSAR